MSQTISIMPSKILWRYLFNNKSGDDENREEKRREEMSSNEDDARDEKDALRNVAGSDSISSGGDVVRAEKAAVTSVKDVSESEGGDSKEGGEGGDGAKTPPKKTKTTTKKKKKEALDTSDEDEDEADEKAKKEKKEGDDDNKKDGKKEPPLPKTVVERDKRLSESIIWAANSDFYQNCGIRLVVQTCVPFFLINQKSDQSINRSVTQHSAFFPLFLLGSAFEQVPNYITSNCFIAKTYAQLICAFVRDCFQSSNLAVREQITSLSPSLLLSHERCNGLIQSIRATLTSRMDRYSSSSWAVAPGSSLTFSSSG